MPTKTQPEHKPSTAVTVWSVVLLVLAGVSLFAAQSAYWINHTVFDQAVFSQIVTDSLQTDASRQGIAQAIVDTALQNRPVIRDAVGDRATSFVAGLLGSDIGQKLTQNVTEKVYSYVTTPDRQDIAITLTSAKQIIAAALAVAESAGKDVNVDVNSIPDQIVLVESDSVPQLSGALVAMMWIGPLLWLLTAVLFAVYIHLNRRRWARSVYYVFGVIAVVGLVGLVSIPLIPASVAAAIPKINLRVVAETLTTNFLAPFQTQMLIMLSVTAVVALIFALRKKIVQLADMVWRKIAALSKTSEQK